MNQGTVLVVEDNDITRKVVRVALAAEGYAVLEAPDARVALQLVRSQHVDVVLQDLILPDADGLELVEQLREQPGIEDIPIIAFSGFPNKMAEARNADLCFTDYLIKPVEPSRLVDTIRTHLPAYTGSEIASRGRLVLVVDDDPIQRKLMKFHLEKAGFTVHTATDGLDGLEQARRSPPDAIVSDMLMPKLDGFKFCLQVRQDPAIGHVPIVLTTAAFIEDADRKLAEATGASVFVVRTPNIRNIIDALFTSLNDSSPASCRPAVELPASDYADRIVRQLENQMKLVRDSEERVTRIFELMPVGMIFVDCSGAIIFANTAAERICGLPRSAITARAHDDPAWRVAGTEGEPLRAEDLPLERIRRTGQPVNDLDLSIVRSDGRRVVVCVNAAPLRDAEGHLLGIVESLVDITERKRTEEERIQLLAREQAARSEAEEAVRARDEFLAVAAHELKTPLTSLRGFAQLMARRFDQKTVDGPSWRSEAVDEISRQSNRLSRLVDRLLDASRIGVGKMKLTPARTNIAKLVRDVVTITQSVTDGCCLSVHGPAEVTVTVDALRMEQVVQNLLDNAIKYSVPGGEIVAEISAPDSGLVQIVVRDHGIGIPPEKREHIFDPFFRAHGEKHQSGLGLGLYVASHIVELHGGDIRAEFPADGGTCFTVTLPSGIPLVAHS